MHGWKNQVLKVRMVGKGAAREFKMCADGEKLNHGNTLPEGASTNNSTFPQVKEQEKRAYDRRSCRGRIDCAFSFDWRKCRSRNIGLYSVSKGR